MQMIVLFLLQNSILKHLMASFIAACYVPMGGVSHPPPPTHPPHLPCPALWLPSSPLLPFPPNPPAPRLTWALPLAERWDSFTEAAGCQERWSPRRSRAECMWVTASQKEAFHPPLPRFFPLFSLLLLYVPLFLFGAHE